MTTRRRGRNGEGGIIEQVDEEDRASNDYDSMEAGDEEATRITINKVNNKPRNNLLCKNLLD